MSRLASFMVLSAAFGLLLAGGCGGESEKPKQPPAAQPAQPGGQPAAPDQTSAPATQPKPQAPPSS